MEEMARCLDGRAVWCRELFLYFLTLGSEIWVKHAKVSLICIDLASGTREKIYQISDISIHISDGEDIKLMNVYSRTLGNYLVFIFKTRLMHNLDYFWVGNIP